MITDNAREISCLLIMRFRLPASMIAMAEGLRTGAGHPMQAFMCYWTAFNNIYVTLAEQAGKKAVLKLNPDGTVSTRTVGAVSMARVNPMSEREQIDLAFTRFSNELKDRLISHSSTCFLRVSNALVAGDANRHRWAGPTSEWRP